MTVADDYFARVRPLLGDGLSKHVVEVDDPEPALLVLELLTSCMLEHVVTTRPEALVRMHAWKRPFAPLRTSPATPDAKIIARRGPTAVRWRPGVVELTVDPSDMLAYVDASYHVARTLRDCLLGRIAWPASAPKQPFDPRGVSTDLRGRHVMVIGCGSLGSEALRMLRGARFTLIDNATVTVYNLARQWFGADDVGRWKVLALRDRLGDVNACRFHLEDPEGFEDLVRADPPDVALLATGTHHHAMLGERLWRLGIPHVAACCYPRAQYFEVSIVSPREETPCLHCYRGHLYSGPPEPLPDEIAAFLYQPVSDEERTQRYTDLVAEPATQIETLRAAHVLARCAVELVSAHRTPWFRRVLAEATTCLIGGNSAGAYGITTPGQVVRLGPADVAGAGDELQCGVCGRTLRIALRDELPAALDDLADAAPPA
jgi:hypothetical protein